MSCHPPQKSSTFQTSIDGLLLSIRELCAGDIFSCPKALQQSKKNGTFIGVLPLFKGLYARVIDRPPRESYIVRSVHHAMFSRSPQGRYTLETSNDDLSLCKKEFCLRSIPIFFRYETRPCARDIFRCLIALLERSKHSRLQAMSPAFHERARETSTHSCLSLVNRLLEA